MFYAGVCVCVRVHACFHTPVLGNGVKIIRASLNALPASFTLCSPSYERGSDIEMLLL
jgi:hypothetical protein